MGIMKQICDCEKKLLFQKVVFEVPVALTWNTAVLSCIFFFCDRKQSFQCLTRCWYCPPEYGCLLMAVRGTWNFVRHPATLAQGHASEAHMNMDVNLCRLPDLTKYASKFLVPLAVIMWHPHPADSDGIRSKQRKDSLPSRKICS